MSRRVYVETSALLRALLEGDASLHPLLSGEGLFTSALTSLEAGRAIARARRERRLDASEAREAERILASFERGCDVLAMEEEVIRRARDEFPEEPVRSLDAIHLASLLVLDEALGELVVVSCDDRVRRNVSSGDEVSGCGRACADQIATAGPSRSSRASTPRHTPALPSPRGQSPASGDRFPPSPAHLHD